MAPRTLTEEQIGRISELLRLKWSQSTIAEYFRSQGVNVSRVTISRISTGVFRNRNKENPKPRGPKPKLDSRALRTLNSMASKPDPPTQKHMAMRLGCSDRTIRTNLKKIGKKKVIKGRVHALSPGAIQKRSERSYRLYKRLRGNRIQKIITSDEAWVFLNGSVYSRKIQYLDKDQSYTEKENISQVAHPKGLMVWIAFDWDGFFSPIFVDPKAKVNSEYYIENILTPFLREYELRYPNYDRIFHQDSAPGHMAKRTIDFLNSKKIPFIRPEDWMGNSPDAAPCDFWLWGYLKNELKKHKITSLSGLKRVLNREVQKIPLDMVRRALKSWPRRCRLIHEAKGYQIENRIRKMKQRS